MAKDFIPRSEGQLIIWLSNYKAKIREHGAALGFTEEEIVAQENFAQLLIEKIAAANQAKNDAKQATDIKDTQADTSLTGIRTRVKNLKTRTGSNTFCGE